jgi:cytochrome c
MKLFMSGAAVYLACAAAGALAADTSEREAVAMTEKGAALIKAEGQQALMKRIHAHDPAFFHGALSMNMRDLYTGIVLANALQPALAGQPIESSPEAGSAYPRQVIEMAQRAGKGWIASQFRDPESGQQALRTSYVLRVGDVVLQADIRQQ